MTPHPFDHPYSSSDDATVPLTAAMMQARRWHLLGEFIRSTESGLSLWPGLLTGAPVTALVGPGTGHPMPLAAFLRSAVHQGVQVVYGHHHSPRKDGTPGPEADVRADDSLGDGTGFQGQQAFIEHGLTLQYPAPGGVVHCWTAVGDPFPWDGPVTRKSA